MKSLLKIMLALVLAAFIVPGLMAGDGNFTGYPDSQQIWIANTELRIRDTGQIGFGDGTRTAPDAKFTYDTTNDEIDISKPIDVTGIEIDRTTTANGYTNDIATTWTCDSDMASGGSNGIYAIAKPIEDVQNAYSLRGRMDMREAAEAVAVNQLHAVDALINFNETTDYTITDNISVVGAAVHGGTTSDIVDGYAGGVKPAGSVNLFFGVWGPTATQDLDCITNGVMIAAHEDTYLDYGYSLFNSGTSVAGVYILNHPTELPATMTNGILIESEAGRMTYGLNLSGAGISTADIVFQEGETLDNATNGILNAVGNVQVKGALNYAGVSASTGKNTYVLDATPDLVTTAPTKGQVVTWCSDTAGDGASTVSVDGVSDTLQDRAGNTTAASDILADGMVIMIFDGTNWRLAGI